MVSGHRKTVRTKAHGRWTRVRPHRGDHPFVACSIADSKSPDRGHQQPCPKRITTVQRSHIGTRLPTIVSWALELHDMHEVPHGCLCRLQCLASLDQGVSKDPSNGPNRCYVSRRNHITSP